VAAALEVRGYARAGRSGAVGARPWSRHDVRVAASALLVAVAAVGSKAAGTGALETYPSLEVAAGPAELALCAAVLAGALLPFAGRAARLGVAHG
jgi:hypothetical protein